MNRKADSSGEGRTPDLGAQQPPKSWRPLTFDEAIRTSEKRDVRRLPALVTAAFRLVWRAAPRELLLAGGLQLLAGLSLAAQLLVLRRVLDRVSTGDEVPTVTELAPELLAFGVLLLVVSVSAVAQREQQRTLGALVEMYTTARVMDVSTEVDLISYDRPDFFDRLQRARVNASVRPLQIANGLIGLVGSGAAVVAVGATLVWLEPLVAGLIVLGSAPSLYFNRLSSRAMHRFTVAQTPRDRRRHYLFQVLARKEEAQEVRAFDSRDHLRNEHDRLFKERLVDLRNNVRLRLSYGVANAAITASVTIGALALLLLFVRIGRLDLSDAAVAVGAVVIVAGRIRGLVGSTGGLYEGALFLEDFTGFLADRDQYVERPNRTVSVVAPFDEIRFDGVGFTYPSRSEPSLRDISLSLRRGEVLALVGENGSGKTTLTKLLAGLYRPTAGSITWDGVDVSEVDLADLRRQVTVIFQDFARYFLTAHENIAISQTDAMADRDLVSRMARRAGADDFIRKLPDGYDNLLGPSFAGGSDLSTGQWQRIALARAYFRGAPLLILDEPTAALDPRGEYEIFEQVRRLAAGHSVVLVSHRFASVRAADRIIVLDQGRIVEEGSHHELRTKGGLYEELFELQAQGYRGGPSGGEADTRGTRGIGE